MRKKIFLKTIFSFLIFLIFVFSISGFLFAQNNTPSSASDEENQDLNLPNPLQTTDVSELAGRIIKAILGLVGVFALVMFIYGGMLWMTSGGSEEKVKRGRDTLVWAMAGLALIFFSYAILEFLFKILLRTQE